MDVSRRLQPGEPIWIHTGKSRVIEVARPVKRVSIGNPDLAGIVVLGPRTIMINAKEFPREKQEEYQREETGPLMLVAGRPALTNRPLTPEPHLAETTLVIWDAGDGYDVHSVVIADFIEQQVMLDVTVAELNRTAMEQHGIDFRNIANSFVSAYFMGGGAGPKVPGLVTTVPPQIGQPLLPLTQTDTAPTYVFNLPNNDITAFIQLLQVEGLATVLAQPQLVAMSGQSAVFQVGGEIPIRIATGFVADVQFKPFGTLVNFVPRVSEEGDIILTVTPEVSQPDFNSPVEGIPSFLTRRASTSTRLRNGETLVIGGLLQTRRREEVRGVPYLQDLPGVGYVFRSTIYENLVTELMVVVTPHIVTPLAPSTEVALPTDRPPLTREDIRTKPDAAEVTRPRFPGVLQ
ncbi:MAG TPA: pilus assembly protein N-terminal domain-containing protein [Candidatus Nitrosopolaris sp.]|nr:pilus assembly protein N-terminal domain-containing protein [Candidatus Nitrosopolaris sp.]